jgi:hypothetical protein
MNSRDVVCPHCGYDFPWPPKPDPMISRTGIEYSAWADIALSVGIFFAFITCAGAMIGSVFSILSGNFLGGLIGGPISFFLSLAMLVVFRRVQNL